MVQGPSLPKIIEIHPSAYTAYQMHFSMVSHVYVTLTQQGTLGFVLCTLHKVTVAVLAMLSEESNMLLQKHRKTYCLPFLVVISLLVSISL